MIEKCSDILKKAGHGEESTTASSEVVQDQIPQIVELPPDDEVFQCIIIISFLSELIE